MNVGLNFKNTDGDSLLVEISQCDPVALQLSTIYLDEDGEEEMVAFISIDKAQAIQLAHKILEVLA